MEGLLSTGPTPSSFMSKSKCNPKNLVHREIKCIIMNIFISLYIYFLPNTYFSYILTIYLKYYPKNYKPKFVVHGEPAAFKSPKQTVSTWENPVTSLAHICWQISLEYHLFFCSVPSSK